MAKCPVCATRVRRWDIVQMSDRSESRCRGCGVLIRAPRRQVLAVTFGAIVIANVVLELIRPHVSKWPAMGLFLLSAILAVYWLGGFMKVQKVQSEHD